MKQYTSVRKLISLAKNGIPWGKIMTMAKNIRPCVNERASAADWFWQGFAVSTNQLLVLRGLLRIDQSALVISERRFNGKLKSGAA